MPMDLLATLPRRDVLLLLLAAALAPRLGADAAAADEAVASSGEFVIINGWVLPRELFGRE
jgi:hypothetical protein